MDAKNFNWKTVDLNAMNLRFFSDIRGALSIQQNTTQLSIKERTMRAIAFLRKSEQSDDNLIAQAVGNAMLAGRCSMFV